MDNFLSSKLQMLREVDVVVKVKLLAHKGSVKEFEKMVKEFIEEKKNCQVSHGVTTDPEDKSTTFTALVVYD